MMSRACAGLARGRVVVALPGLGGRRAAGDDPAAAAGTARTSCSRPRSSAGPCVRSSTRFRSTRPAPSSRPRRARSTRVERVPLAALAGRVLAEDVIADADVPPVRPRDDGRLRGARRRHRPAPRRRRRPCCASSAACSPARCSPAPSRPASCVEIATGAPLAGRRRRRRDGRGDRARGADGRRPVAAAAARRPARRTRRAPTSPAARRCSAAGDLLLPGRARRCWRRWAAPTAMVFARPRVAIVSTGNEVVAPGQPLGPGQIYDINRHTLSADRRGARWRARCRCDGGRRHPRGARPGGGRRARLRRDRVLGRQLGGRSRPRARRAAPPRRGRVPRHRDASGQAHGVRPRRRRCRSSACPAIPTSCLTNAYVLLVPFLRRRGRGCRRIGRASCGRR